MTECATDATDGFRPGRRCISSIPIMAKSVIAKTVQRICCLKRYQYPTFSMCSMSTERWDAMDKYKEYEKQKRQIALTAKSAEEYQKRIGDLAKRLGI